MPASAESGSKWKQRARKPVPQYTGSTALKPTGSDDKCEGAQPECHSLKPSQKCTSVGHRGSVRGRRSISTLRSRQTVGRSGLPHRRKLTYKEAGDSSRGSAQRECIARRERRTGKQGEAAYGRYSPSESRAKTSRLALVCSAGQSSGTGPVEVGDRAGARCAMREKSAAAFAPFPPPLPIAHCKATSKMGAVRARPATEDYHKS